MSNCIKLRLSLEWMEKNYRIIVINENKKFEDLICYIWLLWWFTGEKDQIWECYLSICSWYEYNEENINEDEENNKGFWKLLNSVLDNILRQFKKNECVPEYRMKLKEYDWEKNKKMKYYYDNGIWTVDIEYMWKEECKWNEAKVIEWKWGKMIEEFEWGVEEIEELIRIYKEKDEKETEEKWYADYETLKREIENVVLKEIDWSKYSIKDELKKIKEEEGIDLLKRARDLKKCYEDEDIR